MQRLEETDDMRLSHVNTTGASHEYALLACCHSLILFTE